ncbi:hypothetical protein VNO80_12272 [Phaseolus coccineus]|uniref:Uncharacterized protein n=1 Tax=Phaseolus coccineus TaxID=3886 RepID=A0AAN9N0D0_PHACN
MTVFDADPQKSCGSKFTTSIPFSIFSHLFQLHKKVPFAPSLFSLSYYPSSLISLIKSKNSTLVSDSFGQLRLL